MRREDHNGLQSDGRASLGDFLSDLAQLTIGGMIPFEYEIRLFYIFIKTSIRTRLTPNPLLLFQLAEMSRQVEGREKGTSRALLTPP